jgi:glycosyltransferase involved in cell wall biosynthesis
MIWLASFPRSGNTFFRNVLYNVYGLESSTFHIDDNRPLDKDYASYPIVKTHLLPDQLVPENKDIPAVYIVRDGRDALVSLAHHRKDIVEPGTDFENNLLEAIVAKEGSHFGGWATNVESWSDRANVVIRFEDLIVDPIKEAEKLRSIIDLPQPDASKLPSFEDLKYGQPKYGGGGQDAFDKEVNKKNFRRGKTGAYREEMSEEIERLFWRHHGASMSKFGYGHAVKTNKKKYVLIEGSKFFNEHVDGIGRYVNNLVSFLPLILNNQSDWEIDLFHKNAIIPIYKAHFEKKEHGREHLVLEHSYEKSLLSFKKIVQKALPPLVYNKAREIYVRGPWRQYLKWLRRKVNENQIEALKEDLSELNKKYDLVHAPIPQSLGHVSQMGSRFVTTVHDTTHRTMPQFHLDENTAETEEGMQMISALNSDIIAVSNSTAADLSKYYDFEAKRVHSIYEGIHPDIFHKKWRKVSMPHKDEQYKLPEHPFILSLSTLEPRKNITGTIQAFSKLVTENPELEVSLVIAGRKGWKFDDILDVHPMIKNKVIFTGYVEDEDLPYLYSRAHIFSYVSHYEGFGLPLLEAMGCGTPVIYGDNSAMAEIIGLNGFAVEPDNVEGITSLMLSLLVDHELWDEFSEKSWQHANRFTWLKMAHETVALYQKLIES